MSTNEKTAEEIWQETLLLRDKQKKEAESSGRGGSSDNSNFKKDWINVEYLGLKIGEPNACRIHGVPVEFRRDEFDPKFVLTSKFLKDSKDGMVKINWPSKEINGELKPDPDWILTRLMDAVRKSDWVEYEDSDIGMDGEDLVIKQDDGKIVNKRTTRTGRFIPYHKDKECAKRLDNNFFVAKGGKRISCGVYPSVRAVMNVLDRLDDWCKNNKMLKVLTNKLTTSKFEDKMGVTQTRHYADVGISGKSYGDLVRHFKNFKTGWMNTDVVIERTYDGKNYGWDISDATTVNLPENIKSLVVEGELTEEEKAYTPNNLDAIETVTSPFTIRKHLEGLFKTTDMELDTEFLKELNELCSEELVRLKALSATKEVVNEVVQKPVVEKEELPFDPDPPKAAEVSPIRDSVPVVEAPPVVERPARTGTMDTGLTHIKDLPFWGSLDEIDQEEMLEHGVVVNGSVNYPKAETKLIACNNVNCTKMLPATVYHCPYCGTTF